MKRFVIDGWIENQRRFHVGNAERKSRQARRRHVLGLGLFGATLLMAVIHLSGGHHAEAAAPRVLRIDLWVTFLALALPVWAGTVHAITSQMELERIAERSGRMARVLERLGERARRAQTPGQLQEVCAETAAVMTTENHEWWVLLSFQDVRLHV